jgi:hypothetical protein
LRDVVGADVAGTVEVDTIVTAVTVAAAANKVGRTAAILVAEVVRMARCTICWKKQRADRAGERMQEQSSETEVADTNGAGMRRSSRIRGMNAEYMYGYE